MISFSSLERRLGFLSFPGFLRFYIILYAMVYLLQAFRPEMDELMRFDRALILQGEVWRVITFLFSPGKFLEMGAMGAVVLFITVMLNFMVSDALEGAWGVFKTSMFFHAGIVILAVLSWVMPQVSWLSGYILVSSAFFAFATLFPRAELMFMFVIPVQVRFLGWVLAASLLYTASQIPSGLLFALIGLTNYVLWVAIPALRGVNEGTAPFKIPRRIRDMQDDDFDDAFHTCASCDRTEVSDPELEFRVGRDGREYCLDHLRDN